MYYKVLLRLNSSQWAFPLRIITDKALTAVSVFADFIFIMDGMKLCENYIE